MKQKKILLLTVILFVTVLGFSQAPLEFNYQAIARDSRGAPLAEKNVAIRFSIRNESENGETEYMEIRKLRTNQFGMFSVAVGSEGAFFTTGTLQMVKWESGKKYLYAEIDPNGGNNYVSLGATQLVSVPYAIFALRTAQKSSGSSFSGAAGNGLSIKDSIVGLGNSEGDNSAALSENRIIPLGGKTLSIADGASSVSFRKELITIQQDSNFNDPEDLNRRGNFLRINPIYPRPDAVPFLFNRSATEQHGGSTSPNEVVTWGHNIGNGGGAAISGLPGIGYSLESNYKPTKDSRLVESHEFYITPAGRQVRLKSYTIFTENDFVDFYHSTHTFYIKNPITGETYFSLGTGTNDDNNKQLAMGSLNIDINEANKQVQLSSLVPQTELFIKNNWSRIYLPGLLLQQDGLLVMSTALVPELDKTGILGSYGNRLNGVYSMAYTGSQLALKGNWGTTEAITPTSTLDIEGIEGFNQFRLRKTYTPSNSSDPNGATGDMAWDENYIYIKTESGWKRTSLTNF